MAVHIATHVPVEGRIARGIWLNPKSFEHSPKAPFVGFAAESIPVGEQVAYEVAAGNLNQIAKDGDVVVCRRTSPSGDEARAGNIVVVRRERSDGYIEISGWYALQSANGSGLVLSSAPDVFDGDELDQNGLIFLGVGLVLVSLLH